MYNDKINYDIAVGINEDDYVLDDNSGDISIDEKFSGTNFSVGQYIDVWFADEDDSPLRTYKVIAKTGSKIYCEYIGG